MKKETIKLTKKFTMTPLVRRMIDEINAVEEVITGSKLDLSKIINYLLPLHLMRFYDHYRLARPQELERLIAEQPPGPPLAPPAKPKKEVTQ